MSRINLYKSFFYLFPLILLSFFFSCDAELLNPIQEAIEAQTATDPPVALFSADPLIGLTPLQVTFTNTSTGNINSIEWDFNNDGITDSTEENPTHSFETTVAHTSYSVCLTVNGPGGTGKEIKTDYIDVYLQLHADFITDVTEGDYPLTVQFSDNSAGDIISWDWTFGDGESSTLENPPHTYDDPGIYTVALTVTDSLASTDDENKTDYITAHPWHGIKFVDSTSNLHDTKCAGALAVNGNNVYVLYSYEGTLNYNYLRLAHSSDGGESFSYSTLVSNSNANGEIYYPSIKVNGTYLYISFLDIKNSGDNIYTMYSSNGGSSWSGPFSRDSRTYPGTYTRPGLGHYGNRLFLTTYYGTGEDIPYDYTNNGTTWSTATAFDTSPFDDLEAMSAAIAYDGSAYTRYFVYDGYLSAIGNRTLCNGYGAYEGASDYTSVYAVGDAVDGNDIYIAHHSGGNLYCTISTTGGTGAYSAAWTTDLLDSTDDVGEYPSIIVDGSNIYIAYFDATNISLEFVKSTNSGTNWSTPVTVDNAANVGKTTAIAIDGDYIFISYYDDSSNRIKLAKSIDAGDNWD